MNFSITAAVALLVVSAAGLPALLPPEPRAALPLAAHQRPSIDATAAGALGSLQACSPPVRALKPRPGAAAEAGSGLSRATKRKVAVTFFLVVLPLYYGFGAYGPSGAVTVAGLMAFIFLALP